MALAPRPRNTRMPKTNGTARMVIQRWANEDGSASRSAARDEDDRGELWEETVWSVGLIGSVLLAIAAIAQFAV